MKKVLYIIILTFVFVSCKSGDEECNDALFPFKGIHDYFVYFGIPMDMSKCQPLAIVHTHFGWRAFYGAFPNLECIDSTDGIVLKPYVVFCEDKDTLWGMEEYMDGTITGRYFVPYHSSDDEPYDIYWYSECELCYLKTGSADTVRFHLSALPDSSMVCFDDDVDKGTIKNCKKCGHYSIDHSSFVMLHEIIKNINLVQFNDVDMPANTYYAASPDGQMQLYNHLAYTGGNVFGSVVNNIVLAYNNNGQTCLLYDFSYPYYQNVIGDTGQYMNFGLFYDFRIHCTYVGKTTYYFIESNPIDESPTPIGHNDEECYDSDRPHANYWDIIAAYKIERGKLVPSPIMSGKSTLLIVADSVTQPMNFSIIPDENVLCVPHVEGPQYIFNGKYDRIKLAGR